MFHLRQLQCARALAEHRHFGRAADAIGITQSGLTQSIATLETYYGVQLSVRDRSGAVPTAFGVILLDGAKTVLDRVEEIGRQIALLDNLETGRLSVGVDPMLASAVLSPALAELLQSHPKLRFTVRSGSLEALSGAIDSHDIDLYLGFPNRSDTQRWRQRPFDLPAPTVVMAAGHPLTRMQAPSIRDYLSYPLVQGSIAQWYIDWVLNESPELGTDPDVLAPYFQQTADAGMLISIVRRSEALVAVMREDARTALDAGEIVELPPPGWPARVPAVLLWAADLAVPPAAERRVDAVLNPAAILAA